MEQPDGQGGRQHAGRLRLSGYARVWLFIVLLAVAGALVGAKVAGLPLTPTPVHVPWWLLILMFAACESFVVHIHFGRETQAFSLGEIPLVIGLAFASPMAVILARLAASALALPLQRKQTAVKIAFNSSLFVLESGVVLLIHRALLHGAPADGPLGWISTITAVNGGGLLGTLAVVTVMSLHQRSWRPQWRAQIAVPALGTFANTCFGLVAVILLAADARAAWLLCLIAALVLLAYRSYTSLSEKHESLQTLQQFTRDVGRSLDVGETTLSLMQQVRALMRAETAEILLQDAADDFVLMRLAGDADGIHIERVRNSPGPIVLGSIAAGVPILARRGEKRPDLAQFLSQRRCTDAMIVPLRSESTVGALIVTNRLSDVATFSDDDLHVCETIANHASVLLENSRLVQRLRAEVTDKEYQATHDVLTGLANRTLFRTKVAEAIESRQPGSVCAVMLLDLDRFKEVNDTLGHHIGDSLLQQVAHRLLETIPHAEVISRLGGDEFAILVHAADVAAAMHDAEVTRQALEQPFKLPDLELYVGASVGVALAPAHGDSAEILLQRADVAMYAAKIEHTGCELYAAERDSHSHERLALVGELRSALAEGGLSVHYQPKVSLADRKVVGFEALVRWEHPERGFIPPDDFIPVAERTGLIRPLTEYVLAQALAQCRVWRRQAPDMHVAVNLSSAVVLNMDLPGDLRRVLDAAHLPASALTLEITESTIMSDPDRAVAVLETLAVMGVRLSIDDFGTGYSSLSHLKRLPVTELKIDKSFVLNMAHDDNDAVIVRSTIDLARNLNRTVVAEGIEDETTWHLLAALGCETAQGYHIARPMPAHAVAGWLGQWHGRGTAAPADRVVAALPA